MVDGDGTGFIRVGDGGYEFAWSPDATHIAYHVASRPTPGGDFHEELWVVSRDGSDPVSVLPHGCCPGGIASGSLAWSPDGARVAFYDAGADDGRWVVTAAVGSDTDRSLADLDHIGAAEWLTWQPCLCTAGRLSLWRLGPQEQAG